MANPTETRLARLLAYFENGAATIRATLAYLQHDPTAVVHHARVNGNGNRNGHPLILDALALDEHRRAGKKPGPQPGSPRRGGFPAKPGGHKDRIRQQRERTAAALALFDVDTPRTTADVGITRPGTILGSSVRRGYLKKKRDGYVRTSKPFHVDPEAATK